MGIKAGWQGALYWCYEGTLGSAGVLPAYALWQSDTPDTLSLAEQPIIRDPLYGHRMLSQYSTTRATQLPAGAPGVTPISFSEDGSHLPLMKLLQSHFQYSLKVTGGTNISRLFYAQENAGPANWTGMSFIRTWGVTDAEVHQFTGGVCDQLVIAWSSGQSSATISPSFKFLSATSGGTAVLAGGTLDSTVVNHIYPTCGNMTVTLNGTNIHPASFKITSKMGLIDQISPSSSGRNGFACGPYRADIDLGVWIGDTFYTDYIDTFGATSVGTLVFTLNGPTGRGTTAHANYPEMVITAYVQPKNQPNMSLKKGAGIETISLQCAQVTTYTPLQILVYTLYSGASI